LAYGLIAALMMSVLAHILVPAAQAQLSDREADISRNVTARLLTEGTFLNPASGVTFYTREISEDGVLRDVFLSDRRAPTEHVMYTASEAYLVRSDNTTTLIMVDGLAQRLATEGNRLSTAKFQDFSFDITSLISNDKARSKSIRNMQSIALLFDWPQISKETGAREGDIAEELHSRFAQALFCIVAAMIGYSTLLLGGFSRFGVWREVVIAFFLLIVIDGLRSTLVKLVLNDASMWPIMYIPAAIGTLIVSAMLGHVANPHWWRRKVMV
jgi:lipopolysaccharide export system permease protein